MSESKQILCSKIIVPDDYRKNRTFKKEAARQIADSSKVVGLLQPIGVVPVANTDTYRLVFGEHRLVGYRDIRKEEAIPCIVFPEFDDEDRELAQIAENLYRTAPSRTQFYAAVGRWSALYEAKYPDHVGKGKAGAGAAKEKANAKKKSESEAGEPTVNLTVAPESAASAPEPEPVVEPTPSFASLVAGATGQSVSSAERATRIARGLTPEQLSVLESKKVTQADLIEIVSVPDLGQRAAVVNLVASGMDVTTALKSAKGEEVKAEEFPETGMEDAAWLTHYCSEIRARLVGNTDAFDCSALVYRHTTDARRTFKGKVSKVLSTAKAPFGHFTRLCSQICSAAHPRDWLVCGTCSGSGNMVDRTDEAPAVRCNKCGGDGFKLKWEK